MVQQAITNQKQKHLSAFDLTSNLIRGGLSSLNLSPNTKLVLLYLSTCYNAKKGVVFPKLKTIAEAIGISEVSCKRAVKELLKENCILKSKRFKNSNEYILTNKVLNLNISELEENKIQNDTSPEQIETSKGIKLILPIEHEIKEHEIKEQQPKEEIKKVVAFSSNSLKSLKPLDLQAIPAIIKENPNIKNPVAYWRSLDDEAKASYIKKEQEAAELKARREAEEKEREKRSYENYLKHEARKNEKPFTETCSKDEAISYIQRMYGANQTMRIMAQHSRVVKQLVDRFNFNLDKILA